jgi:hypothetical protein
MDVRLSRGYYVNNRMWEVGADLIGSLMQAGMRTETFFRGRPPMGYASACWARHSRDNGPCCLQCEGLSAFIAVLLEHKSDKNTIIEEGQTVVEKIERFYQTNIARESDKEKVVLFLKVYHKSD